MRNTSRRYANSRVLLDRFWGLSSVGLSALVGLLKASSRALSGSGLASRETAEWFAVARGEVPGPTGDTSLSLPLLIV